MYSEHLLAYMWQHDKDKFSVEDFDNTVESSVIKVQYVVTDAYLNVKEKTITVKKNDL